MMMMMLLMMVVFISITPSGESQQIEFAMHGEID